MNATLPPLSSSLGSAFEAGTPRSKGTLELLRVALASLIALPGVASAQNIFPATGRVGIGTTTPAAPLNVYGAGGGYGAIFESTPGMNFVMLRSRNGGGNYGSILQFTDNTTDSASIKSVASGGLRLATAGKERFVVDGLGNVGIGTLQPAFKLDVDGRIRLRGGTSADSAGLWLHDSVASSDKAFVGLGPNAASVGFWAPGRGWGLNMDVQNGHIGIGTVSPQHPVSIGAKDIPDWQGVALRVFDANPGDGWRGGAFGGANATVMVGEVAGTAWLAAHSQNLDAWKPLAIQAGPGLVGIGTVTPAAKLDVVGDVLCTSLNVRSGVRCTTLDLTSDRAAKAGLKEVDERGVLERLARVPISTWHYKEDPSVQHIGPMAQDFKEAFGMGADDKHISVVDGVGVSLAAIQGLHRELKTARENLSEQDREIAMLREELAELRREIRAGGSR